MNSEDKFMYRITATAIILTALLFCLLCGWASEYTKNKILAELDIQTEELEELGKQINEINEQLSTIRTNFTDEPKEQNSATDGAKDRSAAIETPEKPAATKENISNFAVGEECNIPNISTNVKLFTDYRVYSIECTPHYRLQQAAYTDSSGFRRFGDDYIVALGSYYSQDIGDRFRITLDTGVAFTVILGDGKAPKDCDSANMYAPIMFYGENTANVIEFIVDSEVLDPEVIRYGSVDIIPKFKGNVTRIVYLGRDNSSDWTTYTT